MRTSGVASANRLTAAVFLITLLFIVMLSGGPADFMHMLQQGVESVVATIVQLYKGTRV